MAKKKSKSQKYKKNRKKRIQKSQSNQIAKQNNIVTETNKIQNKENSAKESYKVSNEKTKSHTTKKEIIISKVKDFIEKTKTIIKTKKSKKTTPKKNNKEHDFVLNNKIQKKKKQIHNYKSIKKDIPKVKSKKKEEDLTSKSIFYKVLYKIHQNSHIIFNTIIIVAFIIMLIGLIRINVLKSGTIIYICSITIFLMTVAISYNKYLSGKIFSIILTIIMSFAIWGMQYTYDFIRNLNSTLYEYKTYYVVTFNTSANRSIYNLNNKKVGLSKENNTNIERKLDTKLDKVNYNEYEDINQLYDDFYNQKLRAIIVTENQYKYLTNYINKNSREVKILYEFEVNAKK